VALPAGRTVTVALPPHYPGGTLTITGARVVGGTGTRPPCAVAQILRRAGGPAATAGPRTALVLPPVVTAVHAATAVDDPRAALVP
jgi:hypothetical protein